MRCLNLDDIEHNLGCNGNAPGIVQRAIFGFVDDVATWPAKPTPVVNAGVTTPMTMEQAGGLVGDIVMGDGKRAFFFDFTEETGNLKIAPGGQVDSTNFTYTLTLIKAKITKKVMGFLNAASSNKVFFLVQDQNGIWYLLGNKTRGVTVGGDGADTGTSADDRNQVNLTLTYRDGMALVYEGDTEDLLEVAP